MVFTRAHSTAVDSIISSGPISTVQGIKAQIGLEKKARLFIPLLPSDTPMSKHPQPERSYFPISPRRRLLLLAVVTAICVIPVAFIIGSAFSGDGALAAVGFVLFLVTSPFSVLLLVAAYKTRLSIDERGLEARGTVGMSSVSVPWDEIQRKPSRGQAP